MQQIKVLGVTLQDNLSWNAHISDIAKAAARQIHILKSLKKTPVIAKHDLNVIYNNITVSVLEYSSKLFIGMTNSNRKTLEKIRKPSLCNICGSNCECDNLPILSDRREKHAMKAFNRILNLITFVTV